MHVPSAGGSGTRRKPKARTYGQIISPPPTQKAEPRTLYVSRPVKNAADLVAWAKAQGFPATVPADDMHVTVAYSRQPVDWTAAGDSDAEVAVSGGARSVEPLGDKGAVVLKIEAPALAERWQEFRNAGASWDWPGYKPHVTITYRGAGVDLSKVEPFAGDIVLGPERFAEVNEDWADTVTEKRDVTITGTIAKTDEAQRLVFGWASVVDKNGEPVVDLQGHRIAPATLEKAVYDFVLNVREAGENHERVTGVGKLVESLMVTPEKLEAMGLAKDALGAGWWVGFKVEPDVFAKVQGGDYSMFSIGGRAVIAADEVAA